MIRNNTSGWNWKQAFANREYAKSFGISLTALLLIGAVIPFFFQWIEQRKGRVLQDVLLKWCPSMDVSAGIFLLLWLAIGLTVLRCVQDPRLCLRIMIGYTLLCSLRILSLSLVPLDPPEGLLTLRDPLTGVFYANRIITKDLFFSGHSSTLFLFAFTLQKRLDKWIGFSSALAVSVLLVLQHIHYTIDILPAPFLAFLMVRLTEKLTHFLNDQSGL